MQRNGQKIHRTVYRTPVKIGNLPFEGYMHIPNKFPPSSVRSGSSVPPAIGTRSPEPRLYFIGAGIRQSVAEKRILPLFPHESEDARLTGDTRSLFRRLLALNLPIVVNESVMKVKTIERSIEKIA